MKLKGLSLVLTGFLLLFSVTFAWWNDDFPYRTPIYVKNPNNETLYAYQVSFNIAYNEHMKPDFSDIRFIASDWYNYSFKYMKPIRVKAKEYTELNYQIPINVSYNGHMKEDFSDLLFVFDENFPWKYKREINITDTSGQNLINYQVMVQIDTQTLISQGKMRSDCGDIRFFTQDGRYIPYWIEDGTCNTPNTNIWIKVPEIPVNRTTKVYMYYGNPEAESESNIDKTFIFGDDFNDGVLDTNKWTFVSYNGGSYSENNGYIELIDDSGVEESATIHSYGKYNIGTDTILEYKAQYNIIGSPPYGNVRYGLFFTGDFGSKSVPIYYYGTWWNPYSGSSGSLLSSNGSSIATFTRPDMGVDFRGKLIIASNGDVKYYINNNLVASANDYPLNKTSGGVVLALAHNGASETGYNRIYWVFVRKYASSEPTVSIGDEQTVSPSPQVIPHWIEHIEKGKWAYVWVKLPFVLKNKDVYVKMYYGNSEFSSENEPEKVFEIFDPMDSWGNWRAYEQRDIGLEQSYDSFYGKYSFGLFCRENNDWDTQSIYQNFSTIYNRMRLIIYQKMVSYIVVPNTYWSTPYFITSAIIYGPKMFGSDYIRFGAYTSNTAQDPDNDLISITISNDYNRNIYAEWDGNSAYKDYWKRLEFLGVPGNFTAVIRYAENWSIEATGSVLDYYNISFRGVNIHTYHKTNTEYDLLLVAKYQNPEPEIEIEDEVSYEIPYWIEEKSDGIHAKVWIKVPEIPANGQTTVYMYYGNPAAESESNFNGMFIDVLDNLVGMWSFDEGSGTTVKDYSGNNNDGTMSGSVVWTTGKFGNALDFQDNGYVDMSKAIDTSYHSFSVCLWVKRDTETTSDDALLTRKEQGGTNEYLHILIRNNKPYFGFYYNDLSGNTFIHSGTWYFLSFIYDYSNNIRRIYVNGNIDAQDNPSSALTVDVTPRIGLYKTDAYLDGKLDEVYFFGDALTQEEVQEIYNNRGYASSNYPGYLLIRKYAPSEPSVTLGTEQNIEQQYTINIDPLSPSILGTREFNISFEKLDDDISEIQLYENFSGEWESYENGNGFFHIAKDVIPSPGLYGFYFYYFDKVKRKWFKTKMFFYRILPNVTEYDFSSPEMDVVDYQTSINISYSSGMESDFSNLLFVEKPSNWYDLKFKRRVPIWIRERSGNNLAGFNIRLNLTKLDGMKSDFSDIRFVYDMKKWKYKKPITITDTSGSTLTDYQVMLTIDTQSLISAGKMRSDCGDIRFADTQGNLLPYWIEDGTCNSADTHIWVKIPVIPANGNTTVYMYYGNPDATSESNGNNVFLIYDDFNRPDSNVVGNGWTEVGDDTGTKMKILNNMLSIYPDGAYFNWYLYKGNLDLPIYLKGRFKIGEDSNDRVLAFFGVKADSTSKGYGIQFGRTGSGYSNSAATRKDNGSVVDYVYSPFQFVDLTWYNVELIFNKDGSIVGNITDGSNTFQFSFSSRSITSAGNGIVLAIGDDININNVYFDDVFARKYVDPEPTITLGLEQSVQNDLIKLPYYISQYKENNYAIVYVKVPYVAANNATIVWMYYDSDKVINESDESVGTSWISSVSVEIGKPEIYEKGLIKIPYWIEEKSDREWAYIWIKVPYVYNIEANDWDDYTRIWFTFGTEETSEEKPKDVFDFFDDFSNETESKQNWMPYKSLGTDCGYRIENGLLNLSTDHKCNDNRMRVWTEPIPTWRRTLKAKVYRTMANREWLGWETKICCDPIETSGYYGVIYDGVISGPKISTPSNYYSASLSYLPANQWVDVYISVLDDHTNFWRSDGQSTTINAAIDVNIPIDIGIRADTTGNLYVDYIYVRKEFSIEKTTRQLEPSVNLNCEFSNSQNEPAMLSIKGDVEINGYPVEFSVNSYVINSSNTFEMDIIKNNSHFVSQFYPAFSGTYTLRSIVNVSGIIKTCENDIEITKPLEIYYYVNKSFCRWNEYPISGYLWDLSTKQLLNEKVNASVYVRETGDLYIKTITGPKYDLRPKFCLKPGEIYTFVVHFWTKDKDGFTIKKVVGKY